MWSSNGSPRRRVSVVRCAKRINNRTESLETATNLGGDCVAFGRRGHLYALLCICFFYATRRRLCADRYGKGASCSGPSGAWAFGNCAQWHMEYLAKN